MLSRPEAVKLLESLLRLLFPESNSLDMITVEDVARRYPLTGLGAPALAAIEQAQRIIRARADDSQTGLAEFHIGLIYLNWGDCRAAAGQFALARKLWLLANDLPAACLAHFAQGLGLYYAFHKEAAMIQFGRAEQIMKRSMVGAQGARLFTLADAIEHWLRLAQDALRIALWPDEMPPASQGHYQGAPPPAEGSQNENVIYGRPPSGPATAAGADDSAPHRSDGQSDIAQPVSNLRTDFSDSRRGPVPGHIIVDDRFGWYQVAEKKSDFLPAVNAGDWLLADREVDERLSSGREYVVVGSRRTGLGSITVQPLSHSSFTTHCYFGYRVADESDPSSARLYLGESAVPISDDILVLAVVEGYWIDWNGYLLAEV
jgi:hypothetical protein